MYEIEVFRALIYSVAYRSNQTFAMPMHTMCPLVRGRQYRLSYNKMAIEMNIMLFCCVGFQYTKYGFWFWFLCRFSFYLLNASMPFNLHILHISYEHLFAL